MIIILFVTIVSAAVEVAAAADVHFEDSPQAEHLSKRHNRLRSHSSFDKPTSHPTTLDYFNSPYYYGYYGNNVQHPHQHFYEWPDRDPSSHSYSPTTSPTTTSPTDGSIIPTYTPTAYQRRQSDSPTLSPTRTSSPSSTWDVLTSEHFLGGFGVFQEVESQDIQHYSSTLGRRGVIKLQNSAAMPSYNIAVDSSQLKVAFSFYANSMNVGEGFCLEYSLNEDTDWNPVRCWQSSIDFENNQWYDDFYAELNLDDRMQVDSLRIKFESIARRDNVHVMFDRVTLLQLR